MLHKKGFLINVRQYNVLNMQMQNIYIYLKLYVGLYLIEIFKYFVFKYVKHL